MNLYSADDPIIPAGNAATGAGAANLAETRDRVACFSHDDDLGIVGRGASIEAAFVAAAEATFGLMTDIPAVVRLRSLSISFDEPELERALPTWLNTLLAEARATGLALGRFHLRREGTRWIGAAWGEPWRPEIVRGMDVRSAASVMISVKQTAGGWEARCLIDAGPPSVDRRVTHQT
jgi:SHS2 domain-containing protein